MFNSKKPDAPPQAEKVPMFATSQNNAKPFAAYAAADDANCSIINQWLTMRGDLESTGDILVKGRIIGNVKCKLLIIDTDAHVEGGIVAEEVVIRGATRGTIESRRVRVEKTADIDSEISHEMFSAEEGARVRGTLRYNETVAKSGTPERSTPREVLMPDVSIPSNPASNGGASHSPLFNMLEAARNGAQRALVTP